MASKSLTSLSRNDLPVDHKLQNKSSKQCDRIKPLLHTGHYSVRMGKISKSGSTNIPAIPDFKIRRDNKKNFYERRVYESVDDRSLSWAISQKTDEKKNSWNKGLNYLNCKQ